jgi:O-succinylbenzoic acid--CoA ligase
MIPLQVKNSLKRFDNIKTLIVGGASVSKSLIESIQYLKTKVYETFGMTETISHVAVKMLNYNNSKNKAFELLPNVTISKNENDCLVIEAPKLTNEIISTNDIINLISENQFELIGRYDNMINSGGVKLFPELIELKLQDLIEPRFFIASEKDSDLGQKVILIIENDSANLNKDVFSQLQKHEVPKVIYNIPKFLETETGKLQRKKILDLILT